MIQELALLIHAGLIWSEKSVVSWVVGGRVGHVGIVDLMLVDIVNLVVMKLNGLALRNRIVVVPIGRIGRNRCGLSVEDRLCARLLVRCALLMVSGCGVRCGC